METKYYLFDVPALGINTLVAAWGAQLKPHTKNHAEISLPPMTQQDCVELLLKRLDSLPVPDINTMDFSFSFSGVMTLPKVPAGQDTFAYPPMHNQVSFPTNVYIPSQFKITSGAFHPLPPHRSVISPVSPGENLMFTNAIPMYQSPGENFYPAPIEIPMTPGESMVPWPRQRSFSVFEPIMPASPLPLKRKYSLPLTPQSLTEDELVDKEGQFICTHPCCNKTFPRIQNLRSHKRCHLPNNPHQCPHCPKAFKRTTDLSRHVRSIHTPDNLKPFSCSKCSKRFGRSDALKRHQLGKGKDGCQ